MKLHPNIVKVLRAGFTLWGAGPDGTEYHLVLPSGRVGKRLTVTFDGQVRTSRFFPSAFAREHGCRNHPY